MLRFCLRYLAILSSFLLVVENIKGNLKQAHTLHLHTRYGLQYANINVLLWQQQYINFSILVLLSLADQINSKLVVFVAIPLHSAFISDPEHPNQTLDCTNR